MKEVEVDAIEWLEDHVIESSWFEHGYYTVSVNLWNDGDFQITVLQGVAQYETDEHINGVCHVVYYNHKDREANRHVRVQVKDEDEVVQYFVEYDKEPIEIPEHIRQDSLDRQDEFE